MLKLSSYPNVFNTCLVLVERQGYSIGYEKARGEWQAKKGVYVLIADNPIELLGLAAVVSESPPDATHDYWWRVEEPNLLAKLNPE